VSGNEFSYGDPLADVGTPGWARRVRVVLLDAVDGAKFTANHLCGVLDQFVRNRGWMLLDTKDGRPYRRFEDFVAAPRPWGLGIEYPKFCALVMTEIGKHEFDRLTASQPAQGERSDLTSCPQSTKSKHPARLRAINRAPAVIKFEDFVAALRPWGLGIEYAKFRALVMTEIGEREFDRLTASQPTQGERSDKTSHIGCAKSGHRNTSSRLRAVDRAPAVIRKLFDDDLIAVDVAAKFGPAPPRDVNGVGHERQGELGRKAEALQERVETIRVFRADLTPRKLKQEINAAAREILQLKERTREEWLRHWWKKCTAAERRKFLLEVS
jgi:hypothetical protein